MTDVYVNFLTTGQRLSVELPSSHDPQPDAVTAWEYNGLRALTYFPSSRALTDSMLDRFFDHLFDTTQGGYLVSAYARKAPPTVLTGVWHLENGGQVSTFVADDLASSEELMTVIKAIQVAPGAGGVPQIGFVPPLARADPREVECQDVLRFVPSDETQEGWPIINFWDRPGSGRAASGITEDGAWIEVWRRVDGAVTVLCAGPSAGKTELSDLADQLASSSRVDAGANGTGA